MISKEGLNLYGIQGESGSGKTRFCLSFPNPLVLDLDKKLPAGVRSVPFWDSEWVRAFNKGKPLKPFAPCTRDAVKYWLQQYGSQLPADTTLILDGWTSLQNYFDTWGAINTQDYTTKKGDYDGYAFYAHKILYSLEIINALKALPCRAIITFHEIPIQIKGQTTHRYRPLMSGQFQEQIPALHGNFWRTAVDATGNYILEVKTHGQFVASTSADYKFPSPTINITDKNPYEEISKYSTNLSS